MSHSYLLWALIVKEIKEIFRSPIIYTLAALFTLLTSLLFFFYLSKAQQLNEQSLIQSILIPTYNNIHFLLVLFVPLLSMRSFAEERRQNTYPLFILSRLNFTQIILGKFLSSYISVLFLLSLTLMFPLNLAFAGLSDWGVIISNYLGLTLALLSYTAVGIFASGVAQNQIIAAVLSFSLLFFFILFPLLASLTSNYGLVQMIEYIGLGVHFGYFTQGAIRSYSLVFYGSFTLFFLYLTYVALEMRSR